MRAVVGLALLALAVFCFFFLILPAATPSAQSHIQAAQAEDNAPEPLSLGIDSAEISTSGNESVAVLRIFATGNDGGKIFAYCGKRALADSILILRHPSVPGFPPKLPEQLAREIGRCGFSSGSLEADDALLWKDAVIISPTGAVPLELANQSQTLQERNLRLIVIEGISGKAIGSNGSMLPWSFAQSPAMERVPLLPSGENEAARTAALLALVPTDAAPLEIGGRGKMVVVAVPLADGQIEAHCRVYHFSDSSCRFSDSVSLRPPRGTLQTAGSALAGQETQFEFSISGEEAGRRLKLYAVDYLGRGEVGRKEVADGIAAEGWAGAFSMALFPEGNHVVWLVDQFGRKHASAYVEVKGFSASLVAMRGNQLEFSLKSAGQPLSGPVEAWIGDGEKKQYVAEDGRLVIFASPGAGEKTLHLSYLGMEARQTIAFPENPVWNYLRLLLASLLFIAAVFLLLRAGSRAKYRISFPEMGQDALAEVVVSPSDLLEAYKRADKVMGGHKLPASPEEIGRQLAQMLGMGKAAPHSVSPSPQSTKRALSLLSKSGLFLECGGQFIPVRLSGGFSAGQLSTLRLVHDLLLERGIKFSRRNPVAAGRGKLELFAFSSKQSVFEGIGSGRRVVLFESPSQLHSFCKSLSGESGENTMVKIAEKNGKLSFALATRKHLGAILP